MKYTVVGLFEDREKAELAALNLREEGFDGDYIDVSTYRNEGEYKEHNYEYQEDEKTSGFWDWLFGNDGIDEEDKHRYSRVGSRSAIVSVYVPEHVQAERVTALLDSYGAIDVNEKDAQLRTSANMQSAGTNPRRLPEDVNSDVSVDVIKEDIAVGKREVEKGSIRLRSRIIEKPVQEKIRLRDERVYITRKPVDKPVNSEIVGTTAFDDQTIEMTAYAEEAVVEKSAKVVEEITVNKEVTEHEEVIRDTVRETEVDIVDTVKENQLAEEEVLASPRYDNTSNV